MANGILVVDKPVDWTSMDVCAKLRGIFRERRVGHAGTLDPMATGVLPVFLGRATRCVSFAADSDKEYIAELQLGVITDTQDVTGTVLERRAAEVSPAALEGALALFRGEIFQIPPMYSAVKLDGKKLYELARKGLEVERAPRPVTIHALELLERTGEDAWLLRVACSKGTYVRTLCHDIGGVLGCGGALRALRRTRAAGFSLEQAVSLGEIQAAADAGRTGALLRGVDSYFDQYPALTIGERALTLARNGNPFPWRAADGDWRVYGPGGEFLLLGRCRDGVMTTIKSFFEV